MRQTVVTTALQTEEPSSGRSIASGRAPGTRRCLESRGRETARYLSLNCAVRMYFTATGSPSRVAGSKVHWRTASFAA